MKRFGIRGERSPRGASAPARWAALLLLGGLIGTAVYAADWPQWRGPDRTGVSHETGLLKSWPAEGPKMAWKATGLGEGYSAPSVAKGKITAAQASQGMEQMRGISPIIFAAIGAAAAAIFTFIFSLCWALFVFLAGKVLGGPVSFGKAYEITGLAYVVNCLGILAASGLILLRDSLALPNIASHNA